LRALQTISHQSGIACCNYDPNLKAVLANTQRGSTAMTSRRVIVLALLLPVGCAGVNVRELHLAADEYVILEEPSILGVRVFDVGKFPLKQADGICYTHSRVVYVENALRTENQLPQDPDQVLVFHPGAIGGSCSGKGRSSDFFYSNAESLPTLSASLAALDRKYNGQSLEEICGPMAFGKASGKFRTRDIKLLFAVGGKVLATAVVPGERNALTRANIVFPIPASVLATGGPPWEVSCEPLE
jgi:hypothetical protein